MKIKELQTYSGGFRYFPLKHNRKPVNRAQLAKSIDLKEYFGLVESGETPKLDEEKLEHFLEDDRLP
jgi:hypothetical protein